jgi:hypothetical protein
MNSWISLIKSKVFRFDFHFTSEVSNLGFHVLKIWLLQARGGVYRAQVVPNQPKPRQTPYKRTLVRLNVILE